MSRHLSRRSLAVICVLTLFILLLLVAYRVGHERGRRQRLQEETTSWGI